MKAAVVEQWGQIPAYADYPELEARDGEVIATVEASALTNLTRGLMSGKHYASREIQLPAIAGFSFCPLRCISSVQHRHLSHFTCFVVLASVGPLLIISCPKQ